MRSLYNGVPGVCNGLKRVGENTRHGWNDTPVWCRRCAGYASECRLGKRLKDVCRSRDSRLAYHLRRLEQGYRLGRNIENVRKE